MMMMMMKPNSRGIMSICLVILLSVFTKVNSQVQFPGEPISQPSGAAPQPSGAAPQNFGESNARTAPIGDQIFFPNTRSEPEVSCTTYKGETGTCRLLVKCTTFFKEIAELSRSPCNINNAQDGVCCPPRVAPVADIGNFISKKQQQPPSGSVPDLVIENRQLNFACTKGLNDIDQKDHFVKNLMKNNIVAEKGSPVYLHAQLFQTTNEIVQKSKEAEKIVAASVNLQRDFNLDKNQAGFGLPKFGIQNTIIENSCPREPICPETKYRAQDAKCNNRKNKDWGRAGTAFQRILPPDYDDGVNSPRQLSVTGVPLPSPRAISSNVIIHQHDAYDNLTLLIMQWGQFLDHDITHTPITKGEAMADVTCCTRGQKRQPSELHPDCLPIEIPSSDSFFAQFGQRCMEFVRSMPAIRPDCNFGPREQMNQITSFIDASNVYGSNAEEVNKLRLFSGGKLRVTSYQGRNLLPPAPNECTDSSRRFHCFQAGDSRVNEQPELVVMHTIWLRQHNKLANELSRLNPGWNDEVIFQEARRIVAAQMQHITYNEYLPIVLGRTFMETFGLLPTKEGYSRGYREDIDPSITNSFATAAFRYGHTLISSNMDAYSKFGTVQKHLRLSEHQFSPFHIYENDGLDSLLRGLSLQSSEKFDHFFSEELTNHLFAGRQPYGMDLVALNIQRGRDHGLPNYNQWRKICQLPLARNFDELRNEMSGQVINQLRNLYKDVNDIDIFIGGIAEKSHAGSLLGRTFLCIVGDQFARLKLGDRFYYENGGLESSFSEGQLEQIKQTTLARIMCDNSDDLDMMQPLAFVKSVLSNKRALCKVGNLIPQLDLSPWRNEPVWV